MAQTRTQRTSASTSSLPDFSFMKHINLHRGTENCSACAQRVLEILTWQVKLPSEMAVDAEAKTRVTTNPIFFDDNDRKNEGIIRRSTIPAESNNLVMMRLLRSSMLEGDKTKKVIILDDNQEHSHELSRTDNPAINLCGTPLTKLIEDLKKYAPRNNEIPGNPYCKKGSAFGIIVLTLNKTGAPKGHIINYYITPGDQVLLLDAQSNKVYKSTRGFAQREYAAEVFWAACEPSSKFLNLQQIKKEKEMDSIHSASSALSDPLHSEPLSSLTTDTNIPPPLSPAPTAALMREATINLSIDSRFELPLIEDKKVASSSSIPRIKIEPDTAVADTKTQEPAASLSAEDAKMAAQATTKDFFDAVRNNKPQLVQLLLTTRKDDFLNAIENDDTPLMVAAENGHIDIVKMLLDNGAGFLNISIELSKNEETFQLIHQKILQHQKLFSDIDQLDPSALDGININCKGITGIPLIFLAVNAGNRNVIEKLLSMKVKTDMVDHQGFSLLAWAIRHPDISIMEILLKNENVIAYNKQHIKKNSVVAVSVWSSEKLKLLYQMNLHDINSILENAKYCHEFMKNKILDIICNAGISHNEILASLLPQLTTVDRYNSWIKSIITKIGLVNLCRYVITVGNKFVAEQLVKDYPDAINKILDDEISQGNENAIQISKHLRPAILTAVPEPQPKSSNPESHNKLLQQSELLLKFLNARPRPDADQRNSIQNLAQQIDLASCLNHLIDNYLTADFVTKVRAFFMMAGFPTTVELLIALIKQNNDNTSFKKSFLIFDIFDPVVNLTLVVNKFMQDHSLSLVNSVAHYMLYLATRNDKILELSKLIPQMQDSIYAKSIADFLYMLKTITNRGNENTIVKIHHLFKSHIKSSNFILIMMKSRNVDFFVEMRKYDWPIEKALLHALYIKKTDAAELLSVQSEIFNITNVFNSFTSKKYPLPEPIMTDLLNHIPASTLKNLANLYPHIPQIQRAIDSRNTADNQKTILTLIQKFNSEHKLDPDSLTTIKKLSTIENLSTLLEQKQFSSKDYNFFSLHGPIDFNMVAEYVVEHNYKTATLDLLEYTNFIHSIIDQACEQKNDNKITAILDILKLQQSDINQQPHIMNLLRGFILKTPINIEKIKSIVNKICQLGNLDIQQLNNGDNTLFGYVAKISPVSGDWLYVCFNLGLMPSLKFSAPSTSSSSSSSSSTQSLAQPPALAIAATSTTVDSSQTAAPSAPLSPRLFQPAAAAPASKKHRREGEESSATTDRQKLARTT